MELAPQDVAPAEVVVNPTTAPAPISHINSQGNASVVEKEQKFLREKSKRISLFLKHIRSGESKPTVPSNNTVENVLVGGVKEIEKFQNSERGSQLPLQQQVVLGDVADLLSHENALLHTRNDEEQVQLFVHSGAAVAKDIGNNTIVREVVHKWKSELVGTLQRKDWQGIAKLGNDIISTMRQTEAFLELLVELSKMAKIFNNKLGVERSVSMEERDLVLKQMQDTLQVLSRNSLWVHAISVTDPVSNETKEDMKVFAGAVDQSHLDQLAQSGQAVLQSVVGDSISVQPFITATTAASHRIFSDRQFIEVARQTQVLLTQMAEDPNSAQDILTQATFNLILDKLEFSVTTLMQDQDVMRARVEAEKLLWVIKKDPMNRAFLADFQKLRTDASPADVIICVKTFLVPIVIEHLNHVPLSGVKTTINGFGTRHLEISDLKLAARDFLPKDIHVKLQYEFDGNAQDMSVSQQKITAKIEVKNLHINVTEASWRSTGSTVDEGKASFHTSGKGISLSTELSIVPGSDPVLHVSRVDCKMDKFSLVFTESQHDKFYSLLTSMASRTIRKNVEKAITNKIKNMGPILEVKLNEMLGHSMAKVSEMQTHRQQKKLAKMDKKQRKRAAAQVQTPVLVPIRTEVLAAVPPAQGPPLEQKIASLEEPVPAQPLGVAQQ